MELHRYSPERCSDGFCSTVIPFRKDFLSVDDLFGFCKAMVDVTTLDWLLPGLHKPKQA